MFSHAEQAVFAVFRTFQVHPGEMLCFHGPQLEKYGATLRGMTEKNLVVKEQFAGGYSLTHDGFAALSRSVQPPAPASKPAAASRAASRR